MREKVYSTCGEVFNDDQPDYDIGDGYFSGYKKEIKPSELLYDSVVEILVEQMEERLYETVGEVADGALSLTKDKQEELSTFIKNFMDKHAEVSCYGVEGIKEHRMEE